MKRYQMLVNGSWINSSSEETFYSINPFNQKPWAEIPQATSVDIEEAIGAARKAFEITWSQTNGYTRANLLFKLADLIDKNAERLAILESTDNGKVIRETKNQMHFAARNFRFFAGFADKLQGETIPLDNLNLFDYTLREPLGVTVLISAWNSPIQTLTNKLAPALAAGNTVVIKPSEHTSVTTLELGKLIEEAGFPKGIVNIVTGDGKVGALLTQSQSVNKISFTGGPSTGKIIAENASKNLIPCTLELGGKSPNIIFEDAHMKNAVTGAIAGIFGASGQTCIAGSRLLVQNKVYDEVVTNLAKRASEIVLGDPLNPDTQMGPVANLVQFERILSMIGKGNDEGAQIIVGGKKAEKEGLSDGFFILPTVAANVNNNMKIAQEEIFGPVLSVIPFEDEDEAIHIANSSEYGLASGVWTRNISRAHKMAKKLNAGTVWINTYRTSAAQAPFGGVKNSGYGKERGLHALLEYTQIKNVMIDLSEEERDPFSIKV
ncbi:aldehyde dehydrogenase (NAD+) [Salirhabdus euzebyi]|uniref:Aldehyde dehydrogenase (NAD+) n=1 Tax=Salirhabdus euzebyi TaxID=394506 RepID=A0A841Q5Q1_9BACI|nr:aldehyde dehydrogenase [Salirhabdus euzebyi]MBB6453715.1 aldehyde dehydrogenase (NAD+) [Salirhabdus euzebyi]